MSRDNCAIPQKKQARKSFAILSLQVSRDMKSIAAGPLSLGVGVVRIVFNHEANARWVQSEAAGWWWMQSHGSQHKLNQPKGFVLGIGTVPIWTVGLLYGAGAETLIFRHRHLRKLPKILVPRQKNSKSAVCTQKTKKNRCLGIQC